MIDFACPEIRQVIKLDGGQRSKAVEYDSPRS
ncbi:MAG: hypothetical protein CL902_02270 [Dehalococcoidia bacterium]|nr:hypothetical protein [Dehalococcoidia bacterium]